MARKGGNAPRKGKMMEKEGASKLAPRASMRPKARPSSKLAPRASMRPRARPDDMPTVDEIGAIERGNRAAMREAYDQRTLAGGMKYGGKVKKMRNGGKVRGAGKASKGVRPCKMR